MVYRNFKFNEGFSKGFVIFDPERYGLNVVLARLLKNLSEEALAEIDPDLLLISAFESLSFMDQQKCSGSRELTDALVAFHLIEKHPWILTDKEPESPYLGPQTPTHHLCTRSADEEAFKGRWGQGFRRFQRRLRQRLKHLIKPRTF